MPFTRDQLDTISNHILSIMFRGTYGGDEYMNSACIAVTSDGENIYVSANDVYSDARWRDDILKATQEITKHPAKQRPYIWQKNKYRLKLSQKQKFWHQFDIAASIIASAYSIIKNFIHTKQKRRP